MAIANIAQLGPEFSSSPEGSTSITDCQCESGYTGVPSNAMCNACTLGTYKTDSGSAKCVECTANATTLAVASTYASDCSCSVGFSSSHACRLLFTEECRCTECPANYYGTHNYCVACPENTESQPASKEAGMCKCLPGYYKVGTQPYTDVPICSACAAGMYWIEEQCVACPEFSSTAAPAALSVAECACVAGYFMQEEKCKQCPADSFQSTLGGACTVCPLNAISAPGSDSQTDCFCKACFSGADCVQCSPCKEAQYKDTDGSGECFVCPHNTTSSIGSTKKTDCVCLSGLVGPQGGPCTPCPQSTYELDGKCVKCPLNTVAPQGSVGIEACKCRLGFIGPPQGPCTQCPHGFYRGPGNDICAQCTELTNTTSQASDCADACLCVPGYWAGLHGAECEACPINTYKSVLGKQKCEKCPAHSSAPAASTSVSTCVCLPGYIRAGDGSCDRVCAAGFEADDNNDATCTGCAPNFYKAASGNEKCSRCPAHSFTMLHNSTAITDCVCEMGYVWNTATLQCDICPAGQFNNEANSTQCFPCETDCHTESTTVLASNTLCPNICRSPAGFEVAASGSTILRCPPNHYHDGTGRSCTQCPSPSTYSAETGLTSLHACSCRAGYQRLAGVCTRSANVL